MVMHARKHSRLNDGYTDRKDTHLHKDMQYHGSSGLYANDSDDDRPPGSRSSPRYQNKHSYIERDKTKRGGLSLAEEKVSHYLATGSLGRPIPIESNFTLPEHPDQHMRSSSSSNHRDRHGSQSSRDRDYNSSKQSSSYHHSEHSNKGSSYSHGHDNNTHPERDKAATNNGKQAAAGKDKEQVQKSAIRVCGDWSEHISSSGKRYYYNCKTEVSQWEKPKEWNSEMCQTPDQNKSKFKANPSANKVNDVRAARHSVEHHDRTQGLRGNNNGEFHNHHMRENTPNVRNNDSHYNQHANKSYSRDNNRDLGIRETQKSNIDRNRTGENNFHVHTSVPRSSATLGHEDVHHKDYKGSHAEHHVPNIQHGDFKKTSGLESSQQKRDSQAFQRHHDTGQQAPLDDMDISPSPSPSPSPHVTPSAADALPMGGPPPASSSLLQSPQGAPIPTLVNRQTVSEGAIQALQELQKALMSHVSRQTNPVPTSRSGPPQQQYPGGQPGMSSSSLIPLQPSQPQYTSASGLHGTQDAAGEAPGRTSPGSHTSSHSSCGSPTPSDTSSQNAAVTSAALTAAAMKREETAKLTASLSNYYNEKLIGHVLGWQADAVEKQAMRLWEESVVLGSHQCSRVSVDLKRARSRVRIAEIQSTLHEQRIMSSDQQRQEIDSLKTPSSFLPS